MPKRSDREVFSKHFKDNPFKGLSVEQIYKKLKWGNDPQEIIEIYAPEPLVALGYTAKLRLVSGHSLRFRNNTMHLAVGANSNNIYIFPKTTKAINTIPYLTQDNWNGVALVDRTEYYSDKGGEHCYYYHDHEAPYPILIKVPNKHIYMLVPQNFNGRRSYAVIKEGIVG